MSAKSEAVGYAAIVRAAATVATSAIVDREAREDAQAFVMEEINRWAGGSIVEFGGDPEEPEEGTDATRPD